jgi:hypothetical protein
VAVAVAAIVVSSMWDVLQLAHVPVSVLAPIVDVPDADGGPVGLSSAD